MMRSLLFAWALVASMALAPAAPVHPRATPRSTPKPKATPTAAGGGPLATPVPGAPGTPAEEAKTALKLAICGDSTAATFSDGQEYHGWGEYLQGHFTDAVQVSNNAKRGRTARSFIDQGSWKDVLKTKPNYVLIQFGHNELLGAMTPQGLDMTVALREYRKYLGAYVDTARKAGALPIVLSPTHHMAFDPEGKPKDAMTPFVDAAQQLADSRGVPFIDVHAACERLYAALGPAKTKQLQGRPEDPVHFGRVGAWTVASIVAKQLALVDKRLAEAEKPAPGPMETTANGVAR